MVNGESTMDASPLKNIQMGSTSSIFCLGILPTHHSGYQLQTGRKLHIIHVYVHTDQPNCIAKTGATTASGVN
jgi:hypothetical protein